MTKFPVTLKALLLATVMSVSASESFAQGLFTPGAPIRPLENMWDANTNQQILPVSAEEPQPVAEPAPAQVAAPRQVTDVAHAEQLQRQRGKLREAMQDDGSGSTASRDNLTVEAMQVAQWTAFILMAGGAAAFALKKFGQPSWRTTAVPKHMKIVETLSLGRQGGVHLVAIGEERIVIAADHHGIKAMTLLPSWPSTEEDESTPGQPAVSATQRPLKAFESFSSSSS